MSRLTQGGVFGHFASRKHGFWWYAPGLSDTPRGTMVAVTWNDLGAITGAQAPLLRIVTQDLWVRPKHVSKSRDVPSSCDERSHGADCRPALGNEVLPLRTLGRLAGGRASAWSGEHTLAVVSLALGQRPSLNTPVFSRKSRKPGF